MLYEISNERLTVSIDSVGAELFAITDRRGTQYLWQGNPAWWNDRAPVLFPYVGRLYEKTYTTKGGTYSMEIHGFVREMEFSVGERRTDSIEFYLTDTPETYEKYPYHFRFAVVYTLVENRLEISYRVDNRDGGVMDFGIGGHPGFRIPLLPGEKLTDYRVVFGEKCHPTQISFADSCLRDNVNPAFPLEHDDTLPLRHDLFDRDAITLANVARRASVVGPSGPVVQVDYPDMPYLGIWQTPFKEPPFLCIEPWVSLPGREGVREDFPTREDMIHLPDGAHYENNWSITLPQA